MERIIILTDNVCYAFNETLKARKDKTLCPAFFYNVETLLKLWGDGRYNLFVEASTQDSCIVKYKGISNYLYYDHKDKEYKIEKNI